MNFVFQITPNATDVSGQVSPGGRATERPVLARIIALIGRLAVVHCGGSNRSKPTGPPQRGGILVLHPGVFTASWGTPLTAGHGWLLSLPGNTPW